MNGTNFNNPSYPPPMEETTTNPFHHQQNPTPPTQKSPPSSSLYPQVNTTTSPSSSLYPQVNTTTSNPDESDTNPFATNPTPSQGSDPGSVTVRAQYAPPPAPQCVVPPPAPQYADVTPFTGAPSSSSSSLLQPPVCDSEGAEKWGTHVMGAPAVPTVHPDNQKAAFWGANSGDGAQAHYHHHPYLQYEPVERSSTSPMENILNMFNSMSHKAENLANNIWHNLKTGPSLKEAAWGKVNLRAKTITRGGFETLYKQSFTTYPNEDLKKTFACYLSTSTGPVAGTLYLSNIHAAFCSDRPLSFTAPSGQISWSYYKVMVPLGKICAVNPVVMRENQSERYIQIVTVDGHDFWFMGFVNYEKASWHLTQSISGFISPGVTINPPPLSP